MSKNKILRWGHVACFLTILVIAIAHTRRTEAEIIWSDLDSNIAKELTFRTAVKNFAAALQKPLTDQRESNEEWPLEKITAKAKDFLGGKLHNVAFINMTHSYEGLNGDTANFLQIAISQEAKAQKEGNKARADALKEVIKFILDNDADGKNLNAKLRLGPNREDQPIPLLHFALKNGLTKTALMLLEKWKEPISQASDEGFSVYPYAFDGHITDQELLAELRKRGAVVLDDDFTKFMAKNPEKQIEFLSWLKSLPESDKILSRVKSRVAPLEKDAAAIAANRAVLRFAQSLAELAHK